MTTFTPSPRLLLAADSCDQIAVSSQYRARQWTGLAWSLCLVVQVWLLSAGLMGWWIEYTTRYDLLAKAFTLGQTNLPIPINVRHLQLPDPYDPVANLPFRQKPGVPDSCLYNGKLYLYWGPAPALLLTPIKLITGPDVKIGDQYLCFAFTQGLMLVTALMLLRVRRLFFPNSPTWLPAVGLAVAALSTPMACVMTRSAVYEAAIVGGQFFMLLGIYLAWCAISRKSAREWMLLLAAGVALAMAVGCRVSLAVAVTVVGLFVVVALVRRSEWRTPRAALVPCLTFGLPMVASALALGWYNHVRFEQWHEFGQKYQLAGMANLHSYGSLFGIANLWPGLWSYLVRPAAIVGHFPWLIPVSGDGLFPSFIRIPPHYEHFEPITGLLWAMPFVWLVPACFMRTPAPSPGTAGERNWLVVVLLVAAIAGFAPVLLMIGSSQRYLVDLTPPLVIVAMVGFWRLTERPSPRARRRGFIVGLSLACLSIVLGFLLSIEGYSGHFRFFNSSLFERLAGGAVVDQHIRTGQGVIDVNR